ncbi:MAG TPA: cation diffusion facilitator family transporter [Thermoanaerobaculia bacterium]|nr:cation diffusion facilitator family transporter [Thermoanaerobaculia bacterium]
MSDRSASRWALLSIAAAVVTIGMKLTAWKLTGSIGLLSDAAETGVNFLAALVAYWALRRASRPADATYAFGHTKAEYFASGFEGLMILAASVAIAVTAVERLKNLRTIENVGLGLGILVLASAVNAGVALVLLREAKRLRSITLRADAQHLLTDVWTSAGVLVGVLLVRLTGWLVLDPVVALLVAANIVYTAVRLLQETADGLLDRAIGEDEQKALKAALAAFEDRGIVLHDIRTRRAGPRHFIQMHVLVPGAWTVKQGHDVCEEIERGVAGALPGSTVTTHLEPLEDPSSWDDRGLDRHL